MQSNHLVTGPPRSGKTTVVQRTIDRLDGDGTTVGGLYSPEIRDDGERVGFELVDVAGDERALLAHVDNGTGPAVGNYRVDVAAVDVLSERALGRARSEADLVVVDEIASMQLHSDVFVEELERVLDSDIPTLAAVQTESPFAFVEKLKERQDTRLYRVTPETREMLPERLATQLQSVVE